ncbi:MAG: SDR family NAD(P)-dependent oxidoreductase, partial [Microthrixaceae bacterium]|nr:SDR family NAD(P)-dependent oxidoreductase [Microthrixaceae bacterium]
MEIRNSVVVVTGGASGIGAALCRRFHEDGAAHVAVVDVAADAAAVVANEVGGSAHSVDVGDAAAVATMIDAVERDAGPIDLY